METYITMGGLRDAWLLRWHEEWRRRAKPTDRGNEWQLKEEQLKNGERTEKEETLHQNQRMYSLPGLLRDYLCQS